MRIIPSNYYVISYPMQKYNYIGTFNSKQCKEKIDYIIW